MSSDSKKTKTMDQKREQPIKGPHTVREEDQEFLFKAFHDMRNPLHAIMGYTRLIIRKTRDQLPEKHLENLEKVIQSAERLNEIVERMVAFYRKK
jgi:signal transduction histidine kinase